MLTVLAFSTAQSLAAVAASNNLLSRTGAKQLTAQIDRLVAQMQRCWRLPPPRARLTIELRINLDPQGNIEGTPQVLDGPQDQDASRVTAEAIKAVKDCGPYKFDPAEYDTWKHVDITFETSD